MLRSHFRTENRGPLFPKRLPSWRDRQAPGAAADADRLAHLAGLEIDHRDVAGISVGGVEPLLVGRERELPDALADQIIARDLQGPGVDFGHPVGGAERHKGARAVAREHETDRLDVLARNARHREGDLAGDLAGRHVDDTAHAEHLTPYPD